MSQQISLEKLSVIIKEKRNEVNYTQEQLGMKTKINRNMIRLIEKGEHLPSIPQLNELMKELNFTYKEIIEEETLSDVFVAMMGQAETLEEQEGFEKMIERMICLVKYKRLKKSYEL